MKCELCNVSVSADDYQVHMETHHADIEPTDEESELMRRELLTITQAHQTETMSHTRDGYCYCDMCGFTAKVPVQYRTEAEDQCECPDCKAAFLIIADELPEHIAADEPMPTWPISYKAPSPCPTCGSKSERLDYHGIGKRCPRCQTLS